MGCKDARTETSPGCKDAQTKSFPFFFFLRMVTGLGKGTREDKAANFHRILRFTTHPNSAKTFREMQPNPKWCVVRHAGHARLAPGCVAQPRAPPKEKKNQFLPRVQRCPHQILPRVQRQTQKPISTPREEFGKRRYYGTFGLFLCRGRSVFAGSARERARAHRYAPGWFGTLRRCVRTLLGTACSVCRYLQAEFLAELDARKHHRKSPFPSSSSPPLLLRDEGFPTVYCWHQTGKSAGLAALCKIQQFGEFEWFRALRAQIN